MDSSVLFCTQCLIKQPIYPERESVLVVSQWPDSFNWSPSQYVRASVKVSDAFNKSIICRLETPPEESEDNVLYCNVAELLSIGVSHAIVEVVSSPLYAYTIPPAKLIELTLCSSSSESCSIRARACDVKRAFIGRVVDIAHDIFYYMPNGTYFRAAISARDNSLHSPAETNIYRVTSLTQVIIREVPCHPTGSLALDSPSAHLVSQVRDNGPGEPISCALRGALGSLRTVLLCGPSGSGKTNLAAESAVAEGYVCEFLSFEFCAASLRTALMAILAKRPCVLVIDDLEFLAPASAGGETEDDSIAHILKEFLGLLLTDSRRDRVICIACSEKEELIAPDVRTLFEEVFVIPLPTNAQREYALTLATDAPLKSPLTPGLPLVDMVLEVQELLTGQRKVKEESPLSEWSQRSCRSVIAEAVVLPREYPEIFQRFGIPPVTGILLHGPPGTGKSWMGAAMAKDLQCPLVNLRLSDILSGSVGVAEQRVREAFAEAKTLAPCIVFIDEFQALFSSRDSSSTSSSLLTSTLAGCLDEVLMWNSNAGWGSLITVVAATNEPWAVDAGFLRPGRFDEILLVGTMDLDDRRTLISTLLKKIKDIAPADVSAETIALETEGFTAADICQLFRRVCALFCQENRRESGIIISNEIFKRILTSSFPSCSPDDMAEYKRWESEHQHSKRM